MKRSRGKGGDMAALRSRDLHPVLPALENMAASWKVKFKGHLLCASSLDESAEVTILARACLFLEVLLFLLPVCTLSFPVYS